MNKDDCTAPKYKMLMRDCKNVSFSPFAVWVGWPKLFLQWRHIDDNKSQMLCWAMSTILPVSSTSQVGWYYNLAPNGCLCGPHPCTWNCQRICWNDTDKKLDSFNVYHWQIRLAKWDICSCPCMCLRLPAGKSEWCWMAPRKLWSIFPVHSILWPQRLKHICGKSYISLPIFP